MVPEKRLDSKEKISHKIFLLKLLRHPAYHLERLISLVAVLVFFIGIDEREITGLQGLLLPFFVHKCAAAFNYIVHVYYS